MMRTMKYMLLAVALLIPLNCPAEEISFSYRFADAVEGTELLLSHQDYYNHMGKQDQEWLIQLWIQVYKKMFLPSPQGFRLTKEEQASLQKRNETYTKPIPGEVEIFDKLDFTAPESKWKWKKVSEVLEGLMVRGISTARLGKVLSKLGRIDSRVKVKNSHNVKQYLP